LIDCVISDTARDVQYLDKSFFAVIFIAIILKAAMAMSELAIIVEMAE
jgi:hypothetical protein